MLGIEQWLRDEINELFHLENIDHYLAAVGVRGHTTILKEKAITYLLNEAFKVIINKTRRRRVK